MANQWKLSLGGVWLISSLSALILPIFLPSTTGNGLKGNTIAISAVTMFILSFPSSVFAVPLMFMVAATMWNLSPLAITYINVLIMFAVGLLQWFWIFPRLAERRASLQQFDLSEAAGNTRLFTRDPESYESWVDVEGATPFERVRDEVCNEAGYQVSNPQDASSDGEAVEDRSQT